ncbi:hypothetical protein VC178_01440 [Polynucleobacter sp. AP-Sanab-80-C2]|uniref:hypothetical protein n=1 Tax=Polynucleobacter sp. AP-Sanab-80-C2 TaxID=3108274 RepID=UPI002B22F227|nr:hypothetical protein [Polynucleobacter sp. AP-Sanab-80-C2]MEA9598557.1 hypothetical protein [Polynucleobacter sp. AP-Sanab-80-C2]
MFSFFDVAKRYFFNSSKYAKFNKKFFHPKSLQFNSSKVILVEFNAGCSNHIAYSYFSDSLSKKYNAKIIGYIPNVINSIFHIIEWHISSNLSLREFTIYKSFGVSKIIKPNFNNKIKKLAKIKYSEVISKIKNKSDVENLEIDGVLVGDLIYDSFLKKYKVPTINVSSHEFKIFLLEALSLYIFWSQYFSKVDVAALICSHCVYLTAIPTRIAIKYGIPAYQLNATHVYRLSRDRIFAYNEFFDYPTKFQKLSKEIQEEGLNTAKARINLRFSGQVGVDMSYSTKSAFKNIYPEKLIKDSVRKKILIAAHCFFDSPHSYGQNLFPDFYEWVDFLGKISNQTNYDWYIKTHPDYINETLEIIKKFINEYPKFKLLPPDCSHHQIILEGIDVALTTYGTIGFEYAALNVPVINCSINNPHIAYDFNIHPKSIDEYRKLLLNLDNLNLKISKLKVYEYYYMHNIYNTDNWLFNNYSEMVNLLGGYKNQFSPKVYKYWIDNFSNHEHELIMQRIKSFIDSDDFRLDRKHILGDHV